MNEKKPIIDTEQEVVAKPIILVRAAAEVDNEEAAPQVVSARSEVVEDKDIPLEVEGQIDEAPKIIREKPTKAHNAEATKAEEKAKKEAAERARIEEEEAVLKAAIAEQAREDEKPASNKLTLSNILGGDILSTRLLRNNVRLMMLVVLFLIIYISNRYSVQKDLIEIDRLNSELSDTKYRALSSSSQLTEKSRESHVLEILKTNKDSVLKMALRPPFIINVPNP